MNKLSKREIILLNGLLFISVVGVGFLLWISPLTKEIDLLKVENIELKAEKKRIDYIISNEHNIRDKFETVSLELETKQEEFTRNLINLDITQIIRDQGYKTLSLERSEIQVIPIQLTQVQKPAYDYELNNILNLLNNDSNTAEPIGTDENVSYQTITVNVQGSYEHGEKLIDALNAQIKTGYVDLFEMNSEEGTMTLRISIYSLQPSQSNY